MTDQRERYRLKLDLAPEIIRAVRARAGFDGKSPAGVVSAALELYLRDEISLAKDRLTQHETEGSGSMAKERK
jgi:hypothetical protein